MSVKKLQYSYIYNSEKSLVYKIEKEKNLYWSKGGVPLINKEIFDEYKDKVRFFGVRTQKRRMWFDIKNLKEVEPEVIQHKNFEKQIYLDAFWWQEKAI